MTFRYDMRDKTLQQQHIVAQRDAENKRMQHNEIEEKIENDGPEYQILAISRNDCPWYGHIIITDECSECCFFRKWVESDCIPSVECSYTIAKKE